MTLITQRAVFPLTETFNIEPSRSTLEVRTVFARASGSDAIGDGKTEASAYRTFQRAILDVPTFIPHNVRYVVDITGLGTEDLLSDFTLPIFVSPDRAVLDFSAPPVEVIPAPLTIFAEPNVVDSISTLEPPGISSDPTSNIRTLNTTKNYAANQHKNRYVVGSGFSNIGVISSNTAGPNSDVEITDTFDFTLPIDIVEESAELRSPDGASLIVVEQLCDISWQGIKLTNAGNGFQSAIRIGRLNASMVFTACTLDGIMADGGGLSFDISTGACNHLRLIRSRGTQWHIVASFIESLTQLSIEAAPQAYWGQCVWDGNPPIGPQNDPTGFFDEVQTISILLSDSIVRNSTGIGVQVPRLSTVKLVNVSLHDCARDGIFCEGKLRCQNVRSIAGSANGGFGIQIRNGGQVQVDSDTDIAGAANELKVGGNAATTWLTFRTGGPPFNEVDLGAAQPELCRLWQP